jgi:hypothetical protein
MSLQFGPLYGDSLVDSFGVARPFKFVGIIFADAAEGSDSFL